MATWEHKYHNFKYPPFLLLHPALIGEQCHLHRTSLWSLTHFGLLTHFVLITIPKHCTIPINTKKNHHGQSQYRCRDPVIHQPYSSLLITKSLRIQNPIFCEGKCLMILSCPVHTWIKLSPPKMQAQDVVTIPYDPVWGKFERR